MRYSKPKWVNIKYHNFFKKDAKVNYYKGNWEDSAPRVASTPTRSPEYSS